MNDAKAELLAIIAKYPSKGMGGRDIPEAPHNIANAILAAGYRKVAVGAHEIDVDTLGVGAVIEYAANGTRYRAINSGNSAGSWLVLIDGDGHGFIFNHSDTSEYIQNQVNTYTDVKLISEGAK